MKEDFLQYLWLQGNFNLLDLRTTAGESITLNHRGILNTHSGPDFSEAKIIINQTKWAGSVEVHTQSSEWFKHKHHQDKAYNNVILHVVYEEDKPCLREDGSEIPCLELKNRIAPSLLTSHNDLIQSLHPISCKNLINRVSYLTVSQMLERTLIERLENKFDSIRDELKRNKGDWQEAFYCSLMRSFGFKTNSEAFYSLAKSLPLRVILKHKNNLHQISALLYGQAGMLHKTYKDPYPTNLLKEYSFLSKKYNLKPMELSRCKYMRMRPANFPSIRIAQIANLIYKSEHLFSKLIESPKATELISFFDVEAGEYWADHYKFDVTTTKKTIKKLGKSGIENIIINTVVPFLFAYAKSKGNADLQDKALSILIKINSENNGIIKKWKELSIQSKNAFESQALIQLFNKHCKEKKCLQCVIGKEILNKSSA